MTRGMRWPIGVAAILAATVAANIWLVVVANNDPSFAIEPNYYQKGVQWDSTLAQSERNRALGWRLDPSLATYTQRDGALLHVALTDADGSSITDATVRVAALFNARAGTVIDMALVRDASGYSIRLPVQHGGQWELRFAVTRGRQRFTAVSRVEAVAAGGGT
jgi:nitrogen fixation protein FixH